MRLLVLAGPTGTGKTELAVAVAERIGAEIVGCDALQVYRGLDAATAKPDADQRHRVPYHLVDSVDPGAEFNLARWVEAAEATVLAIADRGRVPIVCGGTGMYLRGLLRGVLDAPKPDPQLRERLERMRLRFGTPRLHRWLSGVDAASARRLATTDSQRVVRGLELALTEGPSWSERLQDSDWSRAAERYPSLKFILDRDREGLARALDTRVDSFFERGLVSEIRGLLAAGVSPDCNAFRAIGYREVLAALREGSDPDAVRDRVRRNTRRYAKRQRGWFRREPDAIWLDASSGLAALTDRIVSEWIATTDG